MIRVDVHPSAIYNCYRKLAVKGMELAHKYGVQFVTHIAESPDEMDRQERNIFGLGWRYPVFA